MPSLLNEALEWLDRAEAARDVAGQLTEPGAKRALLQAASGYERLARAAAERAQLGAREETKSAQERAL